MRTSKASFSVPVKSITSRSRRAGRGPYTSSGSCAPEHRERAQEPDRAEVVVRVEVGEEDRVHVEPGAEPDHLALRALAAVHEEELALAPHRERGEVPLDRRLGRRGAEEGEAEHDPSGM